MMGAEKASRRAGMREAEIKKLKQKVGELVMDIDILQESQKRHALLGNLSSQQHRRRKQAKAA